MRVRGRRGKRQRRMRLKRWESPQVLRRRGVRIGLELRKKQALGWKLLVCLYDASCLIFAAVAWGRICAAVRSCDFIPYQTDRCAQVCAVGRVIRHGRADTK